MRHIHPASFVSYVHPCNEFSIGYVAKKKKSAKEKKYDRDEARQWERHEVEMTSFWGRVENIRFNLLLYDFLLEPKRFAPLGLSNGIICHKRKRAKRGSKGITRSAARRVRDAATILEQRHGKKLGFYTFTIPSMDKDFLQHFITSDGGWSRLVRTFMQSVCRWLARRGGDINYVGCSEIQSKRYSRRGEIAPHLHVIFKACSRPGNFYLSADELRVLWHKALKNHLDRVGLDFFPIDCRASVDAQMIKKSASGYIGKYMSKGGEIIKEIAEKEGVEYLCSTWVHISKKLKKFVRMQIKPLEDGEFIAIMYHKVDLVARGYLEYLYEVKMFFGDEQRTVGFSGKKKRNLYCLNKKEYDIICM